MASSSNYYVRLKPFNPRRGHYIKNYVDSRTGAKFSVDKGWYQVPRSLADRLGKITQRSHDPDSPLAFEIMSEEERLRKDREAKRAAERERIIEIEGEENENFEPAPKRNDLRLADLPQFSEEGPEDMDEAKKSLGVSMASSKRELMDLAQSLGLKVNNASTKREIFSKIKENLTD